MQPCAWGGRAHGVLTRNVLRGPSFIAGGGAHNTGADAGGSAHPPVAAHRHPVRQRANLGCCTALPPARYFSARGSAARDAQSWVPNNHCGGNGSIGASAAPRARVWLHGHQVCCDCAANASTFLDGKGFNGRRWPPWLGVGASTAVGAARLHLGSNALPIRATLKRPMFQHRVVETGKIGIPAEHHSGWGRSSAAAGAPRPQGPVYVSGGEHRRPPVLAAAPQPFGHSAYIHGVLSKLPGVIRICGCTLSARLEILRASCEKKLSGPTCATAPCYRGALAFARPECLETKRRRRRQWQRKLAQAWHCSDHLCLAATDQPDGASLS